MTTIELTQLKPFEALQEAGKHPLERPKKAGAYWRGVPHVQMVKSLLDVASARLHTITSTSIGFSTDGADMVFTMWMDVDDQNYCPFLGVVTSNAFRCGTTFYAGLEGSSEDVRHEDVSSIRMCLHHFKAPKLVKSHSMDLTIRQMFLNWWEVKAYCQPMRRNRLIMQLQQTKLSSYQADEWLMRAGKTKSLPYSQIGKVVAQLPAMPTSAWDVMKAHAIVIERQSPPLDKLPRLYGFTTLMAGVVETRT